MESFILFYQKCRLCLDNPGEHNMFAKDELPQDIFLCTGVKVHPTDNLPQKMCGPCSKVISSATQLREIATKNDTHLRTLFEGDFDDSEEVNKNNEDNRSSKKSPSSSDKHTIAVRKDLFETSTAVTSSSSKPQKKSEAEHESPEHTPSKRPKLDTTSNTVIEYEYECEVCSKSYTSWKKYYLHKRTHSRKVTCPLDACGKTFATKGDLEKHFRTHTGEKPFKCNLCDKRFTQGGSLKSHRISVHGGV